MLSLNNDMIVAEMVRTPARGKKYARNFYLWLVFPVVVVITDHLKGLGVIIIDFETNTCFITGYPPPANTQGQTRPPPKGDSIVPKEFV